MSIFSALVLTVNMIVNQFCGDFDIKKCEIDIEMKAPEELPWVFDPKGKRRAQGLCVYGKMQLNAKHWSSINDWEKRELVYHELGHCFLGLGHNNDISIMNPFPKKVQYHVKEDGSNWNSLVQELKSRVK